MTGEELRAARRRYGLTQEQFARFLGAHSVTVCRWERGLRPVPGSVERGLERMRDGGFERFVEGGMDARERARALRRRARWWDQLA